MKRRFTVIAQFVQFVPIRSTTFYGKSNSVSWFSAGSNTKPITAISAACLLSVFNDAALLIEVIEDAILPSK